MYDIVFFLKPAADAQKVRCLNEYGVLSKNVLPHNHIDKAGFIFQRQKHDSPGGAGALAADDHSGILQLLTIPHLVYFLSIGQFF